MKKKNEDLYLELIKRTLAFTLWPEPPIPIDASHYGRHFLKRLVFSTASRIFRFGGFQLSRPPVIATHDREEGIIWPGYAVTMIGLKRLDNLQFCIETVIREGIEGDLMETGVWRGGACILMRAVLAARGVEDRKVYVADSFEGLPKPDSRKYPADTGDKLHAETFLAVSQEEVENNFRKYDLLDDQVVILKGWFKDTLPGAPVEKLAVLRLDGDMYSSTMDALTNLYPKLSRGGFCIIDDYFLEACKGAVNDFRAERGIVAEMKVIDWTGVYWRKE